MTMPREQLVNLLHLPLPELTPPGFDAGELAGLRSLPCFCAQLKMIYGLRALAPLAERPASATVGALLLGSRLLSSVGRYVARNPTVTLTGLHTAAALTLIDLQPGNQEPPGEEAELFQSPGVVLLEAAEMAQLRRARGAGQSAESVVAAAGLILELWDFAYALRRSPGKSAGALIHERGWASPATAAILRKLALGAAVGEVVPFRTSLGPATQAAAG